MFEWWNTLTENNQILFIATVLGAAAAAIFGGVDKLIKGIFSNGKREISVTKNQSDTNAQTVYGGNATNISSLGNTHTGTGDIISVDKIVYEYDEEKLINLAENLASKYRHRDAETIKELEKTLKALSQQNSDKYNIKEALDLLSQKKTEAAEKIFELVALEAREEGQESNLKEADALRHIGSLALLHNTNKVLDPYKRSTELDPESMPGWNQLGHLYLRIGELAQAGSTYKTILGLAGNDTV